MGSFATKELVTFKDYWKNEKSSDFYLSRKCTISTLQFEKRGYGKYYAILSYTHPENPNEEFTLTIQHKGGDFKRWKKAVIRFANQFQGK